MRNQMAIKDEQTGAAEETVKKGELDAVVEKAARGDLKALYSLCEKLAEGVLYRARYILGDETGAEDVARDIMLRICENVRTLRDTKSFKTWLGGVVLTEARKHFSKKTRRGNIVSIDDYIGELTETGAVRHPEESTEKEIIRRAVMESISQLPHRQREAVILHYYDELGVTEVAYAMNIPHQSVSRYLALAKKRLASELEDKQYVKAAGVAGLCPVGGVITESFSADAAEFYPANAVWYKNVLAQCHRYILSSSAEAGAAATAVEEKRRRASRLSFGVIASALTTFVVSGALALGILLGGTSQKAADQMASHQAAIGARIEFAGGQNFRGTERVNPNKAELLAGDTGGELSVLQWWIAPAGSEDVLYEAGDGSLDIEGALNTMKESGQYGEYNLVLRFCDDLGYVYRLSSNFYISDIPIPLTSGS